MTATDTVVINFTSTCMLHWNLLIGCLHVQSWQAKIPSYQVPDLCWKGLQRMSMYS